MMEQEIKRLCKTYGINTFKINKDGTIDCNYSVDLSNMNLKEIPIKFNKVNGFFDCSNNHLTNLENSPKYFLGFLDCNNNPLESLDGYNGTMDMLDYDGVQKFIRKEKLKKLLLCGIF